MIPAILPNGRPRIPGLHKRSDELFSYVYLEELSSSAAADPGASTICGRRGWRVFQDLRWHQTAVDSTRTAAPCAFAIRPKRS
jgi:hypothetical protein